MAQGKQKETKKPTGCPFWLYDQFDPCTNTIAYKGRLRPKENSWQPWHLNLYGTLQKSFHQVHEPLKGAVHEGSQTVREPFMNINMCNNQSI